MNSPGGYVYILYGEDTFGRDEAVQTLKDRMRALPAGEHNLTELGPETTVAALRLAADVMPFLADRRMVLVRGLLGRPSEYGAHRIEDREPVRASVPDRNTPSPKKCSAPCGRSSAATLSCPKRPKKLPDQENVFTCLNLKENCQPWTEPLRALLHLLGPA